MGLNHRIDKFKKDPKRALLILTWPILAGMLIQIMYNVVDTAFIGRLGVDALNALTYSFPVFFILIAISSGVSAGMSSRISRFLGAKNETAAENTAVHGLIISVLCSIALMIIGLLTMHQVFSLFGAEGQALVYSIEYISVIFFTALFMFPSNIMTQLFIAQGDTRTPMYVYGSSLILNIILDPIFIFVLDYGVRGAAIATGISYILSLLLGIYLVFTRSHLKLKLSSFRPSRWLTSQIIRVGLPASLNMIVMAISIMFINKFMKYYGKEYVAAFGITARLESVAIMPVIALSFAMMTLVAMFYGAKRYDLMKIVIKYCIKIGLIFVGIMIVIFFIFAEPLLRIFTTDTGLITLAAGYLRIVVFALPMILITNIVARTMQGMGQGLPGFVFTAVRVILISIPMAYVAVFILGYSYLSIAAAMVIGGAVSTIISIIWVVVKFRRLDGQKSAS